MECMRKILLFVLAVIVTAGLLSGCRGGGGSTGFLPLSGGGGGGPKLKVTVIDQTTTKPLAGVTVVLGDSTGAMISSAVTGASGAVTFSNPPADATVTAAYKDIYSVGGESATNYASSVVTDINVSAVTLQLYKYPVQIGTATVHVTCGSPTSLGAYIFPGTSEGSMMPVSVPCSAPTSTTVVIRDQDLQKDGTISFLVKEMTNTSGGLTYGTDLDRQFADGMDVYITSGHAPVSEFSVSLTSFPTTTDLTVFTTGYEARKHGGPIGTTGGLDEGLFSSLTKTVTVIPYYATSLVIYSGYFDRFFTPGPGPFPPAVFTTYKSVDWSNGYPPPGTWTLDMGTMPALATNLSMTGIGAARPVISWQGSSSTTDVEVYLSSFITGTSTYDMQFNVAPTRTTVTVPELPDSLAEFRPTMLQAGIFLAVANYDRQGPANRNDYLSTFNSQASAGAFNLMYKETRANVFF